ncbi:MAG: DegT/DnrJ/EryC1/StrS family aminotransferase, partial [Acidobacteriota bacterium]
KKWKGEEVVKIDFVDLKAQFGEIREEIFKAIEGVIDSQHFILGPRVEEFEYNVAAYCQVKHAVGCASGTDALIISLAATGIGEGDEVITTPFTFFSTASSITKVGGKPVFVDIEPASFNIDPYRIERAVTSRTKAVLPVHLFGQMADMDAILEIAKRRDLLVIEDAAQALGSKYLVEKSGNWKKAGTLGTAGCFSFFPTKNLGGFGDGGMMVTDDDLLAGKMKLLRVHGSAKKYFHKMIGWNSRLDAIQAVVLDVKLKYLDRWSRERRENADRYDALFRQTGLIEDGFITIPARFQKSSHIFNQYTLMAKERDQLRDHLGSKKISTEIYYPIPLHLQECFKYLGYRENDFPNSERAAHEALSLPIYPRLPVQSQEMIVETISGFYRKK